MISVVIAYAYNQPFHGVVAVVPLFDTNPDPRGNPWGLNADAPGLEPDRLMEELNNAFKRVQQDERNDWTINPDRMPKEILQHIPRTVMVLAYLDILYLNGISFKYGLRNQGVQVESLEVNSIHQVKELYNTEEGRRVWKYAKEKYCELIHLAQDAKTETK